MKNQVIIIGAGPAGLSAGMYCLRAGLETIVVEKAFPGGSMLLTEKIDNYPGFPEGISGIELAEKMRSQYIRFGGEIMQAEVAEVFPAQSGISELELKGGKRLGAEALIIASGSSRKKLGVAGESEYTGKGVSFCAVCDGAFFKGKKIAVIGGGNAALEDAVYLARHTDTCYLIHRRDEYRASKHLQEEIKKHSAIKPLLSATVEKICGDGKFVQSLLLKNKKSGVEEPLEVEGVFISVGQQPNVGFIDGKVEQNPSGYIITDDNMQSSAKGVFACGDAIRKSLYQVVNACGEGAVAASSAEKHLLTLQDA